MENKTKFKVGDHVRVIENKCNDDETRKYIGIESIIERECGITSSFVLEGIEVIAFSESELELIPSVKTLENLECGDLIKCDKEIRTILSATGDGESRLYGLSSSDENIDSNRLKHFSHSVTAFDLKSSGYTPYTPEETKKFDGQYSATYDSFLNKLTVTANGRTESCFLHLLLCNEGKIMSREEEIISGLDFLLEYMNKRVPIPAPEPEKTEREKLVEEYAERIVNSECTSHTSIEYILKEFSKRLLK